MTCTWPECEKQDCARCAVLDRCLVQVPPTAHTRHHPWRVVHYGLTLPCGGRDGTEVGDSRERAARQVADRLIAWLAWPGMCFGCGNSGAHPPNLCHAEWDAPTKHPLDATPAAALRGEALVDGAIRWPTVAVILDAIEGAGMWGDVHAWRPRNELSRELKDLGYSPAWTPSFPMGGV